MCIHVYVHIYVCTLSTIIRRAVQHKCSQQPYDRWGVTHFIFLTAANKTLAGQKGRFRPAVKNRSTLHFNAGGKR